MPNFLPDGGGCVTQTTVIISLECRTSTHHH
jgi:hypothetical protein